MTICTKLSALAVAALALAPASHASAQTPRTRPSPPRQAQAVQPPASTPQQFFATKGVEPLTPEREQTLKPRDSFKECDICPEMVVIPKGSFVMGTPDNEPYRSKGEDPQHRVTLAQPIAVGRFSYQLR